MSKSKAGYIDMELDWLEDQARQIREYYSTPVYQISDRVVNRKLMATIEQQMKCRRESLQDYIKIIEAINRLRQQEEGRAQSVRGDAQLSPLEMGDIEDIFK